MWWPLYLLLHPPFQWHTSFSTNRDNLSDNKRSGRSCCWILSTVVAAMHTDVCNVNANMLCSIPSLSIHMHFWCDKPSLTHDAERSAGMSLCVWCEWVNAPQKTQGLGTPPCHTLLMMESAPEQWSRLNIHTWFHEGSQILQLAPSCFCAALALSLCVLCLVTKQKYFPSHSEIIIIFCFIVNLCYCTS